MYFYDVGFSHYEGSAFWQFCHEDKFTDNELFDIVEECLFNSMKSMGKHGRNATIEDLFHRPEFSETMLSRGFKRIQFEQTLELYGWSCCTDPAWSARSDEKTLEMMKRLKTRCE